MVLLKKSTTQFLRAEDEVAQISMASNFENVNSCVSSVLSLSCCIKQIEIETSKLLRNPPL